MCEETTAETTERTEIPFTTELPHRAAPLGRPMGSGVTEDRWVRGFGGSTDDNRARWRNLTKPISPAHRSLSVPHQMVRVLCSIAGGWGRDGLSFESNDGPRIPVSKP